MEFELVQSWFNERISNKKHNDWEEAQELSWAQSYKTFKRLFRRLTLLTWLS